MTGWSVYALAYLGFALAGSAGWFWTLFFIYGLYFMYESAGKAMVADLVRPELRGTAFGLYNFVVSLTLLPASLIMGMLWKAERFNPAFFFGTAMALCALAVITVSGRGEGDA